MQYSHWIAITLPSSRSCTSFFTRMIPTGLNLVATSKVTNEPGKKWTPTFPWNTGWLKTGSLFHGLWIVPETNRSHLPGSHPQISGGHCEQWHQPKLHAWFLREIPLKIVIHQHKPSENQACNNSRIAESYRQQPANRITSIWTHVMGIIDFSSLSSWEVSGPGKNGKTKSQSPCWNHPPAFLTSWICLFGDFIRILPW